MLQLWDKNRVFAIHQKFHIFREQNVLNNEV